MRTDKQKLSRKEIAALVRDLLKKEIPHCKFSVTTKGFSGGGEITIALMEAPFEALTEKASEYERRDQYVQVNHYYIGNDERLSLEARVVLQRALTALLHYHFDESDSQIDYFFCNFYIDMSVGKWKKPFKIKV